MACRGLCSVSDCPSLTLYGVCDCSQTHVSQTLCGPLSSPFEASGVALFASCVSRISGHARALRARDSLSLSREALSFSSNHSSLSLSRASPFLSSSLSLSLPLPLVSSQARLSSASRLSPSLISLLLACVAPKPPLGSKGTLSRRDSPVPPHYFEQEASLCTVCQKPSILTSPAPESKIKIILMKILVRVSICRCRWNMNRPIANVFVWMYDSKCTMQ